MKAATFDYVRPADVDEVCRLLADAGETERKIIAGGQTLVPLMAMRMSRPDMLIDINDVGGLAEIEDKGDHLVIGGCTRQRTLERSEIISKRLPLLAKAIRKVGHIQTRNRGTIGGSIVHGDPTAEISMAALALEASVLLRSVSGEKEVPLDGFFEAAMVTNIEPDQILTEVRIPVWEGAFIGTGFYETASRESDYAIVSAMAQIELAADGTIVKAAVSAGGVAPCPLKLRGVELALKGSKPAELSSALDGLDEEIDPDTDVHATAGYRSRVARRLITRAIEDAVSEAKNERD